MLIRAIDLHLENKLCLAAKKTSCPATAQDQDNNKMNPKKSVLLGDSNSSAEEDDQSNRLNEVFWGDTTRAATHERLEWWLAKMRNLNFPHLEEHLYRLVLSTGSLEFGFDQSKKIEMRSGHIFPRAGIEAGVYLSRYQRPISAQPGLRAR